MAKSGTRQNSKKKRDKRRLLKQQASPAQFWESLDVSGWFDTSVGFEQNDLVVFYPEDPALPSPVYKGYLPGEFYFSFYAHEHPEKKDETAAVRLIKNWCACDKASRLDPKTNPALWQPLLDDLQALAKKGCVTANCFLGHVCAGARHVKKNTAKAREYFQFAAENGDPLAMMLLWTQMQASESDAMLKESARLGCPQAVMQLVVKVCRQGYEITSSELDSAAGWLAAFASKGCCPALFVLLEFLEQDYEERRIEYAPHMLRLLKRLADAGYAEAVACLGKIMLTGILCPKNIDESARLLKRACELGAKYAPFAYAQNLLCQAKDYDKPWEVRENALKQAREMLEEYIRHTEDSPPKAQLGLVLASSENDEDYARGMQYLEETAAFFPDLACKTATFALDWFSTPERIEPARNMLDLLIRRNDKDAVCVQGRHFLLGGILKQDKRKGLKMLHQAADLGSGEACQLLSETYLWGLCRTAPDFDKTIAMLRKGTSTGSDSCWILYALAVLGEIPLFPNPPDSDAIDAVCHLLGAHSSEDEEYLLIAYSLLRTAADSAFRRYGIEDVIEMDPRPDDEEVASEFARHCILYMMGGRLGALLYMSDALGRIAQTKYAALYAAAFAKEIPFMQGYSLQEVCEWIVSFVRNMPDSFKQFRLEYGDMFRAKFRPAVY